MRLKRERTQRLSILLNAVDRLGRPIDPTVLCVAQEMAREAASYAEKVLEDLAVATDLLEEAAATVSQMIEVKKAASEAPVKDLRAYLFRVFMRRVIQEKKKQVVVDDASQEVLELLPSPDASRKLEAGLLWDELMASCGRVAQGIAFRRLEGFSWKEIGKEFGMSPIAAELRFRRAIEQAGTIFKRSGKKG
jgi:DNA-directed RNA polymerase specialized sigma24 family protein